MFRHFITLQHRIAPHTSSGAAPGFPRTSRSSLRSQASAARPDRPDTGMRMLCAGQLPHQEAQNTRRLTDFRGRRVLGEIFVSQRDFSLLPPVLGRLPRLPVAVKVHTRGALEIADHVVTLLVRAAHEATHRPHPRPYPVDEHHAAGCGRAEL